jgi:hypothetical protein
MPEPTPVLPAPVTDTESYRPLSVLAMTSLVIAGVYSLIVLAFGLMSFVSGTPVFLPPWGLAVPLIAIILAVVARRQIQNSEGSRSGLALANWGWRLGLVFGIVHAGIFFGTLLAVGMQAQSELRTNFFDSIRDGNYEQAFVFTIPPDQRGNREEMRVRLLAMDGGKKGPFAKFKENEIVRILEQGGPNANIESMGIKSIDSSKDGYFVVEDYRVTTPEGVFVIQFSLITRDSKEARKRRWQVAWKEPETAIVSRELTPLGEKMDFWLRMARDFAGNWMRQRNMGRIDFAFIDTCPHSEREELKQQYQVRRLATIITSLGAAFGDMGQAMPIARFGFLANVNLSCAECMPGFTGFVSGKFLDDSEAVIPKKERDEILDSIRNNLLRSEELGFRPDGTGIIRKVETDSPHLEALFSQTLAVRNGNETMYTGSADLVVVSDRMPESEAGTPLWRVTKLKLVAAGPPQPAGPRGGAMPAEAGMPPPPVRPQIENK